MMLLHQGIPLTQFISCPICLKVFNEKEFRPISLACGHTVCKSCILNKQGVKKCPFDNLPFPSDVEKLPANYALMQVIGAAIPERDRESPQSSDKPKSYLQARQCIEEMAVHLKPLAENSSDDESKPSAPMASTVMSEKSVSKCILSRPIQRKLISLIHCQLLEEEGRSRSARIARSIGERIVSELLSLQQYPQQMSANLWAAVRTRGCQFLGPAMQEEVLRLILLALEDGSFLSRKVLVLFVVQRLESRYPQASKTAIGHVVQLLYRASCFKVMKRDEASSLMQLKDEFRQYEVLRKEHDAQIVQIALEAGLRIPPEHWSSLLYGDSSHKSHMQSVIDKLQSSQSFGQCIAELMLILQRNGDPCDIIRIQPQLEFLSGIDPSPDCPAPSWENLEAVMRSLNTVMKTFIGFLSGPDYRMRLDTINVPNTRYKTSMCRDYLAKGMCPRGSSCTFAHSQEELERHRVRSRRLKKSENGEKSDSVQMTEVQLLSQRTINSTSAQSLPGNISNFAHANLLGSKDYETLASSCCQTYTTSKTVTYTNSLSMPYSLNSSGYESIGSTNSTSLSPSRHQPPEHVISSQNLPQNKLSPAPIFPATKLTFSEPAKEVPEMPYYPPMGLQTSLHPLNPLAGHGGPACAYAPSGVNLAFTGPPHTSQAHPPWLMGPRPVHPNYKPVDLQQSVIYQPPAPSPQSTVLEQHGQYGASSSDFINKGGTYVYPCNRCQLPMMQCPHASEGSKPGVAPAIIEARHMLPSTAPQEKSLEDLTSRKKEIISHLQEEPTFLDPMAQVYRADSAKGGFAGLKTVLGNNMKKREAMPKLVSDMFVATRSTQSLDMLMYEDTPVYNTQWSMGEDVLAEEEMPCEMMCNQERKHSDSPSMCVTTMEETYYHSSGGTCAGSLYNSLGTSFKCSDDLQPNSSQSRHIMSDTEFSRFPNDDDETFIPFEHTSVSKFGPISRMAKAKTNNCAPVQVTADSSKRMTPVLAVTPLERPLPIPMPVTSRFSSTTATSSLMAEPGVRPTPTEAPSIWQESPQPSFMNIALLKAGAAGAVSNNERLAYELQAVELEISLKTGKVPEPVGKIIQEAVMGHLPVTKENYEDRDNDLVTTVTAKMYSNPCPGCMGHGHVTDCLTMIEHGRSVVSSEKAAQYIMEEYQRSCQGVKK